MTDSHNVLQVRRLYIDTYQEPVIYMRSDCHICRSEGFEAQSRIAMRGMNGTLVATLNVVSSSLLEIGQVGLSEAAWRILGPKEGEQVTLSHPKPLESFSAVRGKIYGRRLDQADTDVIVRDVVAGLYSDIEIASFITACAGQQMNPAETIALTRSMVGVGTSLTWGRSPIVDKHCVGGLPGNRTTMLVVPIVSAAGLTIPKTSSRAITSPAGTADAMETVAPVDLGIAGMKRVVEREGGCIVWGGSVNLSPADDILIRVERPLDLDSEGQLVASVLSKKVAAGSTHVLIDIPVGPTAKVRTQDGAHALSAVLMTASRALGLTVQAVITDGSQPVGRGVGPALEALDVLSVLRNECHAPLDLRERALLLAGGILELGSMAAKGKGVGTAREILDSGRALSKFEAICEAQGGMREPRRAAHSHAIPATHSGMVKGVDNRRLARLAKLAGAPKAASAGVVYHTPLGTRVEAGQPLITLYAETTGELSYAKDYAENQPDIVIVGEEE